MRAFVWVAAVLVALAAGWNQRGTIRAWLTPEPPPRPIVFDNGTVRDLGPPASGAAPAATALPPGVMRKCVRGSETQYTDQPCPPGFKERTVASDRVTVVDGGAPAKPAPAGEPPADRRRNVRDVLDVDSGQLREKAIDRATR